MEHIGTDVHKKESQICTLAEGMNWSADALTATDPAQGTGLG